MVHIIGAGCGAADLITLRGKKHIEEADVIIYAGSLVNSELLGYAKADCEIHDSGKMTLEEIVAVIEEAEKKNKTTVRIQSGDPSLYGAVGEQMREFDRLGIEYDITPGVSAFSGAAAALICFSDAGAVSAQRIADILHLEKSDIHSIEKFAKKYGFTSHKSVCADMGELF